MRWVLGTCLVVVLAATVFTVAGQPEENATDRAGAESEHPIDPAQPGRAGTFTVHVEAAGQRLDVTGPLRLRLAESPKSADVVAPDGQRVARLECQDGACRLVTPVGDQRVPAATMRTDASNGAGPSLVEVTGPDGSTSLSVHLIGKQGVRLTGRALDENVSLASGLAVEGEPPDVDRVRWVSPTGHAVGLALSGTQAGVQVGETSRSAQPVGLWLEGDPFADDQGAIVVETGGEQGTVHLRRTPAGTFEETDRTGELAEIAPPSQRPHANLTLSVGPVERREPGPVSNAFEARARLVVHEDPRSEGGWLEVADRRVADLHEIGRQGDARVFAASFPGGLLGATGDRVNVSAVLQREISPGLKQHVEVAELEVLVDGQPPDPPELAVRGDQVLVRGSAEIHVVQARAPEGPWRTRPVDGGRAILPAEASEGWQVRARGVDQAGNRGPWSQPVQLSSDAPSPQPRQTFRLENPTDGAIVNGTVVIAWRPAMQAGEVDVHVRHEDAGAWTRIGTSSRSPIEWQTRYWQDGDYRLQIRAVDGTRAVSQLLDVTVDNLAPAPPEPGQTSQDSPAREQTPLPGRPLARSLALVVTGTAVGGIALGVAKRRAK